MTISGRSQARSPPSQRPHPTSGVSWAARPDLGCRRARRPGTGTPGGTWQILYWPLPRGRCISPSEPAAKELIVVLRLGMLQTRRSWRGPNRQLHGRAIGSLPLWSGRRIPPPLAPLLSAPLRSEDLRLSAPLSPSLRFPLHFASRTFGGDLRRGPPARRKCVSACERQDGGGVDL